MNSKSKEQGGSFDEHGKQINDQDETLVLDEAFVDLKAQAIIAAKEYRRNVRQLAKQGEGPPKLNPRQVRIPHWTVAASRNLSKQTVLEGGGHMTAAVLSQLLFWLVGTGRDGKPRAHPPDLRRQLREPWTATTVAELAEQIGARPKQVEPCLARLRKYRYIDCHAMRYRGRGRLRGLVVSHVWLTTRTASHIAAAKETGGAVPAMTLNVWAMRATDSNINAALLLSYLWYLAVGRDESGRPVHAPGTTRGQRDGTVVIDNETLAEWLMLSKSQVKRAKAQLVTRGLITNVARRSVRVNIELCLGILLLSIPRAVPPVDLQCAESAHYSGQNEESIRTN